MLRFVQLFQRQLPSERPVFLATTRLLTPVLARYDFL